MSPLNRRHRLQKLRAARGYSQETLARAIGKTSNSISRIERGVIDPALDTAFRIAKALDTTVEKLFPELIRTSFTKGTVPDLGQVVKSEECE